MVSLIIKLYIGIYKFFWRLLLFIFVCPFSKTYRRYAIAFYQPLWWALKLVFSNLAVFLIGVFLFNFNIFLGALFVIGVIIYQVKRIKKQKLSHISQQGFTLLELVIAMTISMIITFGTIGFVRGINAQKNTERIVKEIENIQNACLKMASEKTSFTIDDLEDKGLIPTKFSFTGSEYSVDTDGKVFTISLTLPTEGILVKEFANPIIYSSTTNTLTASYVLPSGHRSIADKNWYGFP